MSEQSDPVVDVARELWDFADRWGDEARLIGNVRAADVKRLCEAAVLTWDPHPTTRMGDLLIGPDVHRREVAAGHLLRALTELRDAFAGNRVLERHLYQAKKAIDLATEAGIVARE